MNVVYKRLREQFDRAQTARAGRPRRLGVELKFPLVTPDGSAAGAESVEALWEHLGRVGWQRDRDEMTGAIVGARTPGEQNDSVASCETGYCKPEFSLAHADGLDALAEQVSALAEQLRPYCEAQGVRFLGYGIQPVTPPSDRLLMKKTRTSVWDKVFGANRCLPPEDGDDVCLFTINAASHVHVSVSAEEAVAAVNVLNAFAPAQLALTANSPVWRNAVDGDYKCVSETFWDRWMPDATRIGLPERPCKDLADYAQTVAAFRPVYVKRDGRPVLLEDYDSFTDYYAAGNAATGRDLQGSPVPLCPDPKDIDLHCTCYWHNARISHYMTVENRTNDQQPPGELLTIAAMTLGLVSALPQAADALAGYDWDELHLARKQACRSGLSGTHGPVDLHALAAALLDVATTGLKSRHRGEEQYLTPLKRRLTERRCPADDAIPLFESGGAEALVTARAWANPTQ